jgi:hypothetical protein
MPISGLRFNCNRQSDTTVRPSSFFAGRVERFVLSELSIFAQNTEASVSTELTVRAVWIKRRRPWDQTAVCSFLLWRTEDVQ